AQRLFDGVAITRRCVGAGHGRRMPQRVPSVVISAARHRHHPSDRYNIHSADMRRGCRAWKSNINMIIIDGMNLAAVDLNLLVAFEALLVERNVSRAAKRIGLAQPSMSSALARLRLLFADELFVRTPREMRPTPRALALAGPVCQALQQIRTSLKKPEIFDPAATERRFMIGGSDNADFSLAPAMAHVLKAAPKIAIEILSLEKDSAVAMLDDGVLDFAVGCFDAQPKRFASAALYRDRYVCVRDRRLQPQRNRLTLEDFARARHLHVALDTAGSIDETLAAHGYR